MGSSIGRMGYELVRFRAEGRQDDRRRRQDARTSIQRNAEQSIRAMESANAFHSVGSLVGMATQALNAVDTSGQSKATSGEASGPTSESSSPSSEAKAPSGSIVGVVAATTQAVSEGFRMAAEASQRRSAELAEQASRVVQEGHSEDASIPNRVQQFLQHLNRRISWRG